MATTDSPIVPFALVGVLTIPTATVWGALSLAHSLNNTPVPSGNPFAVAFGTISGDTPWSSAASGWLAAEFVILAVLVTAAALAWFRPGRRQRKAVDQAAAHLPDDPHGLRRYTEGHTVPGLYEDHGLAVGRLLRRGRVTKTSIRMTWEDVAVVFGGPRMGKTQSEVVPAIAAAPGACIVTSNKADVYDITSALRGRTGEVWLFDPQQIASVDAPTWWWNPLADVRTVTDAERLASIWMHVSKAKDAREDAYFDPEGLRLLSAMVMAAAVGKKPLTAVMEWLNEPHNREPILILGDSYSALSQSLEGFRTLADKQRDGVFGTARKAVSWLDNPLIARWVVETGSRKRFRPADFVRSSDTMYLLSREGTGSAAPLVTAFTATILSEAEQYAQSSGGRLPTPMTAVLDEAANVCRWRELPDLYSHYGSRSIVVITVLQSWAQGAEVWGDHGMEKMWSAANVRVCLGGIPDPRFLQRLSSLCGEWDAPQRSTSTGSGGGNRSRTVTTRREPIMPVGLLAALPAGRALVLLSATNPVVVETMPWTATPLAQEIESAKNRIGEEVAA